MQIVNIQLNMLIHRTPATFHEQINETKGVVKDAVHEIRSLSKTLNNDVILKNGLVISINLELERFNKLSFLDAKFSIDGNERLIKSSDEIIIFRIF